ncbi:MAG: hypothetical protein WA814_05105, partial [Candidatus Baltobacteraceae bacterium]
MLATLLSLLLAQTWLAASDIHLDAFDRSPAPSRYGRDAGPALFDSALAEMRSAVPNPAVVVIAGDFLVHDLAGHARRRGTLPADRVAIETMRRIAAAFGRAYPKAQFAIALGNNDAACGDYRSSDASPYLAAVARIWAPLVERRGAA